MRAVQDLTGRQFGRLTVVKYVDKHENKKVNWAVICSCGTSKTVRSDSLKNGAIVSCGCYKKERAVATHRIDARQNAVSQIINQYKQNARNRKYVWDLTTIQAETLIEQNCFYCEAAPKLHTSAKNAYLSMCKKHNITVDLIFAEAKVIKVNGIDRLDNAKGYTLDNCVPCCTFCNGAKSDKTLQEWNLWLDRIAAVRSSFNNLQRIDETNLTLNL